jgi:Cytochrome b5-like Heme/Steroid binding domain
VTPFLKEHPGGVDSILLAAGDDVTEEFDAIHSKKAKAMLEKYCIGDLAIEVTAPPAAAPLTNGICGAQGISVLGAALAGQGIRLSMHLSVCHVWTGHVHPWICPSITAGQGIRPKSWTIAFASSRPGVICG